MVKHENQEMVRHKNQVKGIHFYLLRRINYKSVLLFGVYFYSYLRLYAIYNLKSLSS